MTAPLTAYIGLGSNLGDREATLRSALLLLDKVEGVHVTRTSTLFENAAVGGPEDAPDFLNAAAELETTLTAEHLLERMMQIERSLGRVRRQRWAPRQIDLDLLLFGHAIIGGQRGSDGLIVPHPLMHERLFVLKPLAEIAPEVVHPVLGVTVAQLLENLMRRK